jgi:glycine cleavage system H protein
VVESVKAASDIYAPISGTVVEVNNALESDPALVNTDPFGAGWIFVLAVDAPEQLDALKTAEQYRDQISGS